MDEPTTLRDRFELRLSAEERALFAAAAKRHHLTLSAWARMTLAKAVEADAPAQANRVTTERADYAVGGPGR